MPVKKKKTRWTRNFYAFGPKSSGVPAPLPPDYANPGGVGDRRKIITPTSNVAWNNPLYGLVEGSQGNVCYPNGQPTANVAVTFDFYDSYIITEAKFYQSSTVTQGIWKWQGSTDNISYIDIGSTFTLGGTMPQIITTLNVNIISYRYYRLQGVSGSIDSGPYWVEFEFKIGSRTTSTNGCSYLNPGGSGNRAALITVTNDLSVFGPIASLVDGVFANAMYFNNQLIVGKFIKFDFLTPKLIDEMTWYQTNSVSGQGVWQMQGSNDNAAWTDIGANFTLWGNINAATHWMQVYRELRVNTVAYRYYRLLGVSGSSQNGPEHYEVEFRIGV